MPSPRRVRMFFYLVLAAAVTILFFSAHQRQLRDPDTRTLQDFYQKTVNGMDKGGKVAGGAGGEKAGEAAGGGGAAPAKGKDVDGDGDVDEDDERLAKEMAERLRAAEQKAKDLANAKAPNKPDKPSEVIGVGSSAGGQVKMAGAAAEDEAAGKAETEEDSGVEAVLAEILKKSPVVIFSKSYCPYSKRAKGILLEKYAIDPAPYVVELDQHELGPKLQERLKQTTGRGTVPNIMINGKSIGGGDDIAQLDKEKTLEDTIKKHGGEGVSVTERFVEHVNAL